MASLDVRKEYACARPFSRALHLGLFERPPKGGEKGPSAALHLIAKGKLR
jgi:hypothetical protein